MVVLLGATKFIEFATFGVLQSPNPWWPAIHRSSFYTRENLWKVRKNAQPLALHPCWTTIHAYIYPNFATSIGLLTRNPSLSRLDIKTSRVFWGSQIFDFFFFRIFLGLQHLCLTTDSFVRELMWEQQQQHKRGDHVIIIHNEKNLNVRCWVNEIVCSTTSATKRKNRPRQ